MKFKAGDKVLIGGLIPVVVYAVLSLAHGNFYGLVMGNGIVLGGYFQEERLSKRVTK